MRIIMVLSLAALACGCTIRHGDFTVLTNKVVRTSDFDLDQAERMQGVVGEDVQHIVMFFRTSAAPSLEEAVDDALEKGDGDVMTDAVVSASGWYIPLIYGRISWQVKGDVVKTRKKQ